MRISDWSSDVCSSDLHAADRVNLHQQDVSSINSRYANASVAIGVSKQASVRHAEMLGFGPDSTLSVLRTSTTPDGVRNTRYQQQFRGVPVYGEHVVVRDRKSTRLNSSH